MSQKYIGPVYNVDQSASETELKMNTVTELDRLFKIFGKTQVTKNKMDVAPPWLVRKSVAEEIDQNWKSAYEEIEEKDFARTANVIGSHMVYKIKKGENEMRLKARLLPHGNRDCQKGRIRNNSAAAYFNVTRLFLLLTTIFGFKIVCVVVKGAYLRSGAITREIYVRALSEV